MSGQGTVKSSLAAVLKSPTLPIRRKHLRRYSWLPDVLRLKGSIATRIVGPVLTVTLWAALVVWLWSEGTKVVFPNTVLPLLSVVVGLVLVFRNGTSYERFWEGRKSFASLVSQIRNLSRGIWVNVAPPPTSDAPPYIKGKTPVASITPSQLRRRKVEALRLALAFAFAVKHYLRGEDGTHWEDYADVLPPSFGRFDEQDYGATRTMPPLDASVGKDGRRSSPNHDGNTSGRNSPDVAASRHSPTDATKRVRPKRSKPNISGATTPLIGSAPRTVLDMGPFSEALSMPLPLLIAHELSRAIFKFRRDGFLETVGPAGANGMSQMVQGMVEQMTAMERVANTPIPASYGIHLKQCVTLYLFALPFTLIGDLGWATVPVVTVVAFTFMGIEGIADEIEMPFGTDRSDLPLDCYCHDLKEEVQYIIERLPEGGEGIHGYDDGEGDD